MFNPFSELAEASLNCLVVRNFVKDIICNKSASPHKSTIKEVLTAFQQRLHCRKPVVTNQPEERREAILAILWPTHQLEPRSKHHIFHLLHAQPSTASKQPIRS